MTTADGKTGTSISASARQQGPLRPALRLAGCIVAVATVIGALHMSLVIYVLRHFDPKWGGPADNWWLGFDLNVVTGVLAALPVFAACLLPPLIRRRRTLGADLLCSLVLALLIAFVQPYKSVHPALPLSALVVITLAFAFGTARRETAHA